MNGVYLSLGSNIGDSISILRQAIALISSIKNTTLLKTSNFYTTSPVSDIKQRDFVNAAILIKTTYNPIDLFFFLEKIEKCLGKEKKPKNMPRKIDIDILFFSNISYKENGLIIPHPRWKERLFVIKPLMDLTKKVYCPIKREEIDLFSYIKNFKNKNNEKVVIIKTEN